MHNHIFLTNIIAYCLVNWYVWFAIYTDRFTVNVVSAAFLLVCFESLKESTCETRKNVFYFTLKALFVLEIIKFSSRPFLIFKESSVKRNLRRTGC